MRHTTVPPPSERGAPTGNDPYPEREDTWLLVPFARSARPGSWVLDVGTGNGRLAVEAARAGARVVATDLNPRALERLRAVAGAERLRIDLVRTDLAAGLGGFDRILSNPPYLPTRPAERDPDRWQNLALDGGPDGARVTRRVVRQLGRHLVPGGRAYLLVSSLQERGALARIRASWESRGGRVVVRSRRRLEGERLEVWELSRPLRAPEARRNGPRTRGPTRGTDARRRTRRVLRTGSSPGPAAGRSTARGGASDRRRSPRGS